MNKSNEAIRQTAAFAGAAGLNTGETAAFIDEKEIERLLTATRRPERARCLEIVEKGRKAGGLLPEEVAMLLQTDDDEVLAELYRAANTVKEAIYGKRVVLFAPLYLSNHCVNNCAYCGYRAANRRMPRRRLSMEEIAAEVRILEDLGHKRLAVECGEHPLECSIDYVVEAIQTIYRVTERKGSIRRLNVNIAATTVEDYQKLKAAGIGTYILFQETYHRQTYARMHPSGPKSDYNWHTTAMDRAMQGGIDDVGAGVLFGLYDYRFEVLALLMHARHLEERFGVGPHTVSVPRLRPAAGIERAHWRYAFSDRDFKKIVAIIRLAVPYTGIILSTREQAALRDELLAVGVSQVSAGSCTGVGSYKKEYSDEGGKVRRRAAGDQNPGGVGQDAGAGEGGTEQFQTEDRRTPDEVVAQICASGHLPSYCTACYRNGRTGERFMALAKSGQIQNVCQPNAILTFKEYLEDYASPRTKEAGEALLREQIGLIKNEQVRRLTEERLRRIEAGERDFCF